MENTNTTALSVALPHDLEKTSSALRQGLNMAKGFLVGHSDDALRAMGKLKDVRKVVNRTGFTVPDWNRAINFRGKVMPGRQMLGDGLTHSIKTPGSSLDKWYNPAGWYLGGSSGYNTLRARMTQGGLFGRGGVAHSTFAANPRLAANFKDLKAGERLLPSLKVNNSYNPTKWNLDTGSIAGTIGRGGVEAGKLGFGVALPASALYGAVNREEGDPRSLGQRIGGSVGSTVGTFASFPLGVASWLPSLAAPFVTDNKAVLDTFERTTPWGIGEYIGEQIGSLGNRKTFDREEYQRQKYLNSIRELQEAQTRGQLHSLPPDIARQHYRYNVRVGLPQQSNIYYGRSRLPSAPTSLPAGSFYDYQLPPGLNSK
jgi:hypothetical protein